MRAHLPRAEFSQLPIFIQIKDSNTFVFRSDSHYIFAVVRHHHDGDVGPGRRCAVSALLLLGHIIRLLFRGWRELSSLLRWCLTVCSRSGVRSRPRARVYVLGPHIQALAAGCSVRVEVATSSGNQQILSTFRLPLDISQALKRVLKTGHDEMGVLGSSLVDSAKFSTPRKTVRDVNPGDELLQPN